MTVLDVGCGPGAFSIAAARLVGPQGRVIAVDVHPLALKRVRRAAEMLHLGQLQALHVDALRTVPDECVDAALMFDVVHELGDPRPTQEEIRRVLKQDGALFVADHHMKEDDLVRIIADAGPFRLVAGGVPLRFELATSSGTTS
jgi:ubiquinone/menaquinone biosynthesis C-methylase UbiE